MTADTAATAPVDPARAPSAAPRLRYVRPQLNPRAIDQRLYFFLQPDDPVCDVYREMAHHTLANAEGGRRLLVTSPRRGAGRTTVALNLASAFAEEGRASVVDCCLRRPAIARSFGFRAFQGLAAATADRRRSDSAATDLVLVADRLSALFIEERAPANLFGAPEVRAILDDLASVSDVVLLDGPPALEGDSLGAVADLAEGIILVLEPADLASGDYERTLTRLEGRHIVGALINDRGLGTLSQGPVPSST
jgi:tyrosine-protein kinase Etk/Wzc